MHLLQQKMQNYSIILGSQSPRRKELLQGLDIIFKVQVKDTDESYPLDLELDKIPEYIAVKKFNAFVSEMHKDDFLITADTIVIKDSRVLQKPKNREEAIEILEFLSNAEHTVITGVCIGTATKQIAFSVDTKVTFGIINKEDILYYIDTYKPFDKAGAYGVQEWIGYVSIQALNGSFYNVMGLPVHVLYKKMLEF